VGHLSEVSRLQGPRTIGHGQQLDKADNAAILYQRAQYIINICFGGGGSNVSFVVWFKSTMYFCYFKYLNAQCLEEASRITIMHVTVL